MIETGNKVRCISEYNQPYYSMYKRGGYGIVCAKKGSATLTSEQDMWVIWFANYGFKGVYGANSEHFRVDNKDWTWSKRLTFIQKWPEHYKDFDD